MEKFDRYECQVSIDTVNKNGILIFDDLDTNELRVSSNVKISALKMINEGKIVGKMIVSDPVDNDVYSDNFIKDINRFLNLIGLKASKNGTGTFFKGDKTAKERRFGCSTEAQISNYTKKVNIGKIFTDRMSERIQKEREKYVFVCLMLDELRKDSLYYPVCSYQLMNFFLNENGKLENPSLLPKEKEEAKTLMKEANELFRSETGFVIGDFVKGSVDKESGFFKYTDESGKAYLVAKKFNADRKDTKLFMLIKALRNIAAHFTEANDGENVSVLMEKFRSFISKYKGSYEEILREMAYDWFGFDSNFMLTSDTLSKSGL